MSHGSAVAIGMALMTKAAYLAGRCDEDCVDSVYAMLRQYGLPTRTEFAPDDLLAAMLSDKKRSGSKISLIVPERIGKCDIVKLPVEEMKAFLRPALEDQTWK